MGRKKGIEGLISIPFGLMGAAAKAAARSARRAAREAEAARKRQIREQIRNNREYEREQKRLAKLAEKEAKIAYLESRLDEVQDDNESLLEIINSFKSILQDTLEVDDTISFNDLRIAEEFEEFIVPKELSTPENKPEKTGFLRSLKKPNWLMSLLPGTRRRYWAKIRTALEHFKSSIQEYEAKEKDRIEKIRNLSEVHEVKKKTFLKNVKAKNKEISEFEYAYHNGNPDAIIAYCTMVLERSEYPDCFHQAFRTAYIPESKQAVVEYELPKPDIIPEISEYKYVKSKDEIVTKPRHVKELKEIYQDIVSAIALRTIHELFEADQGNHIDVIVFNGIVQTVDLSTGQDIRPCLISIRVTKEDFLKINLSRIDKKACIRNLGGQVSTHPNEMIAIKPFIEFDMIDKRFAEENDILSDLESRPNLMDLNPYEFENLVANLFNKLGFNTKITRSHRDGGVDAIAFDTRPVSGGKLAIQAKRYRHVVGVSAVRDLYGTMLHEGANKGILVTTSGYGPDAFHFCKDKPIELIDGGGLLYLLEQAGVKARIIFPEEKI